IRMVSKTPAEAVGLSDRGEIAVGKRADLIRVRVVRDVPAVRSRWRGGLLVGWGGSRRPFRGCRPPPDLSGPELLFYVVGPIGAGTVTLLARARAACRGDATVVFPARVITRPPSIFEDNEFMPPSAFEQAAASGAFAIWWSAHGHMYGIPLAIDFDIEAGRTVVCNVSRTVVAAVRERYANVVT